MNPTPPPPKETEDAAAPRVPVFRTWRGLYWFVFGFFVFDVLVLTAFTRWFR